MLIALILVCVIPLAFWISVVHLEPVLAKRKVQKKLAEKHKAALDEKPERPTMSGFAHHILDEFLKLPEDNRPFSVYELTDSLVALDVKVGLDEVNRHFTAPSFSYDALPPRERFTTNCSYVYNYNLTRHRPHDCPQFDEYRNLLQGILDIRNALVVQEKALAIRGVQPSLDAVKTLTDALRQESDIVNTVTKELC